MSGRVEKRLSRKTIEKLSLAENIEFDGTLADMPCTYCFRNKKSCIMADNSARCSECVRRGRSCDGTKVASSRESFARGSAWSGVLTFGSEPSFDTGEASESRRRSSE